MSQHFFALASSEIYRVLDFNSASADDNGAPISRVADALQTIVASDLDYGQHIRTFRLGLSEENSSNALILSRVLWDSVADPSKVLNTLILLMVRKATVLESFLYVLGHFRFASKDALTLQSWDIPIELSGNVYQALHRNRSLRHLRVRLNVPVPMKTTVHQSLPSQLPAVHAPTSQLASAYPIASGASPFNYPAAKMKRVPKKKPGGYSYWANGRAFSGFKYLSNLALLGISSHDCLGEIAGCLRASSTTLKSLALSLSDDLALKARKPSAQATLLDNTSDTDPDGEDDEEQLIGTTLQPSTNPGQTINEADIRKEKLAQENILAKIFDLQTVAAQGRKLEKSVLRPSAPVPSKHLEDDNNMMADLKKMFRVFLESASGNFNSEQQRIETQSFMKHLAEKYLEATKKSIKDGTKKMAAGSSKFSTTPKHASASNSTLDADWHIPMHDGFPQNPTGLPPMPPENFLALQKQSTTTEPYMSPYLTSFLPTASSTDQNGVIEGSSQKKSPMFGTKAGFEVYIDLDHKNASVLFDSDVVHKKQKQEEGGDVLENFDFDSFLQNDAPTYKSFENSEVPATNLAPQDLEDSMDIDMEHPDETTIEPSSDQEILQESDERDTIPRKRARFAAADSKSPAAMHDLSATARSKTTPSSNPGSSSKTADEEMRDYIRAIHGLQLEELSLYLIPLKASILARALDLNILKRITLLSVGSQDPFWILLGKLQNRSAHISFESIHMDNVSIPFLEFLKTFEGLKELFLLERKILNDGDGGTTKTLVGITPIRKIALRKHIKSLKRMQIRNENDDSWDLDANFIRFLSTKGAGLVELAISLNIKHFVSFFSILDMALQLLKRPCSTF